ncbi:hypothetical protein JCM19538_2922 [Jejuia pallidilutea]|uniref:Uncharacterized protein n=1 Tax=Jejuia pallidilutea TaxID=504487 RepID=A0A098LPP8_9FLAO|nr:hypothetical protein JCM19538_2922 [Jejuia pallidilutea]
MAYVVTDLTISFHHDNKNSQSMLKDQKKKKPEKLISGLICVFLVLKLVQHKICSTQIKAYPSSLRLRVL